MDGLAGDSPPQPVLLRVQFSQSRVGDEAQKVNTAVVAMAWHKYLQSTTPLGLWVVPSTAVDHCNESRIA